MGWRVDEQALAYLSADAPRADERRTLLIEALTFAAPDDLAALCGRLWEPPWNRLPVWARHLAYRLLCLHRPGDRTVLRAAATDLLAHGPDWDHVAAELLRQDKVLGAASHAEPVVGLDPRRP